MDTFRKWSGGLSLSALLMMSACGGEAPVEEVAAPVSESAGDCGKCDGPFESFKDSFSDLLPCQEITNLRQIQRDRRYSPKCEPGRKHGFSVFIKLHRGPAAHNGNVHFCTWCKTEISVRALRGWGRDMKSTYEFITL